MPTTLQSLGIDRLDRDERIALVLEIWDTVAAEPAPPLLTEAQRTELRRRVADHEAHPEDVIPWEQAKSEILGRLKR